MKRHNSEAQFVICVKNDSYAASLEVRKVYRVIRDARATERQLMRVIDESGEDYLYTADYFMPVELAKTVVEVLSLTA